MLRNAVWDELSEPLANELCPSTIPVTVHHHTDQRDMSVCHKDMVENVCAARLSTTEERSNSLELTPTYAGHPFRCDAAS